MAPKRGAGSRPRKIVRAYHEAGHAVASYRLGQRLGPTSIKISGNSLPTSYVLEDSISAELRVNLTWWNGQYLSEEERTELEGVLVCIWAGPAAQAKFRRRSVHPVHARDDLEAIDNLARYLYRATGLRKRDFIARIKEKAEAMMEDSVIWRQVTALAEALATREHLDGEEAEAIISAAGQPLA